MQVPVLDCGGLLKDYELHKVQALSVDIAEMDALWLNYWVSKFVLILWTLMTKGTPKVPIHKGSLKFKCLGQYVDQFLN